MGGGCSTQNRRNFIFFFFLAMLFVFIPWPWDSSSGRTFFFPQISSWVKKGTEILSQEPPKKWCFSTVAGVFLTPLQLETRVRGQNYLDLV